MDNCTAIKNSGIRIAFLYLTYNPLPTNTYYTQHIASFQPNIATAAEACAIVQRTAPFGDYRQLLAIGQDGLAVG